GGGGGGVGEGDVGELVGEGGVLLPVRVRQDAVEQRGLAGAEIAGEHGDGDLVGHRATPFGPRIYASADGCYRAGADWVRRVGKGAEPLFPADAFACAPLPTRSPWRAKFACAA